MNQKNLAFQYHIFWGANSPLYIILLVMIRVRVMVINATFNNISVISWRSILFVEETGVPGDLADVTET